MEAARSGRVGPERFRHGPFVCGYLGPDRAGHWPALTAAAPVPVVERSAGRHHRFAASESRGLETVAAGRADATAWCWGRYVVGTHAPRSWRDAAHEIGMAGFWVGRDEVRLHTDTYALHDLYVRELDGTTYFSNRVHPLAALGDGPLHVDWDAWGTHLFICGFMHDTTGFVEIRRLEAGVSLVSDGHGAVRHRELPDWLLTDAEDATMDEVVDVLLDALPPSGSQEATALGLSGGFDSRLLAILLDKRGVRPPVAWSTDKDEGKIDDTEYARGVAAALGLEHHVVPNGGPRYWARHREPSLLRFEHQVSLHTWLTPLAARVRRLDLPVWDGLLGDVQLRFAGWADILAAGDRERQTAEQWGRWGGYRFTRDRLVDAVRPELTSRWYADGFAAYLRGAEPFQGLPSELKMSNMTMKSNRIIASSPLRLFGPDVPVRMPFISPDVIKVAIRLTPVRIVDEQFYRDLLRRLNPAVAALPSTNDKLGSIKSPGRQGQNSKKVMALLATQIAEDPVVLRLFTPDARELLRAGAVHKLLTRPVLQWGQAMASWRARYAGRLSDDRP